MKRFLIMLICFAALLSMISCSGADIGVNEERPLPQQWGLPHFTGPGQTQSLVPASALEKGASMTYASSDPSVVTVDENGNITSVSPGNAVITITVVENGAIVDHTATVSCQW